jgi:hypothetical protein
MHSFTPFLALCQFFERHHTAFFVVDLTDGSLWIMFEVRGLGSYGSETWRGRG